jgi:hypothetical protein
MESNQPDVIDLTSDECTKENTKKRKIDIDLTDDDWESQKKFKVSDIRSYLVDRNKFKI